TAQTHDSIVGVKGAFEKLLRNVAFFAKQKKYTKIIAQIMITEENLGELSELSSLLKEEGADLIRIGHPTFLSASDVDKNKKICEKHFPGEDISGMSYISDTGERSDRYFNAIKELKNKFNHNLAFLPNLGDSEIRDWYSKDFKTHRKCLFLWRATFIHPNGDVHPCESLKYPIGNIYKEEFDKIWNGKKYIKLRKLLKKGLLPACTRCCKL
ncbi:MAG: radical SAM protein, partial [Candidatus Omnitrophica bacterium]|nr:radical SAM protein [Candidatus Omnitrophota bacterium]